VADEELVFGLRYTGQGEVADLANDLGRIERAVEQLQRVQPQAGSANLLEAISGTLRQQFSALDAARAGLLQANLKAEDVARRTAATTAAGGPSVEAKKAGGFASVEEQLNAQAGAFRSQQTASKALEREYQKATAAIRQSTQSQEAIAAVGKIVQRGLSEQATSGVAAAQATLDTTALGKRLQAAIAARTRADEAEAKATAEQTARTSRLASVDSEFATLQPQPFAAPDLTSQRGRLEERVNAAQVSLELATRKRAAVFDSDSRTVEQMLAAQRSYLAAQAELNAATRNLAIGETRAIGGFTQQFKSGFKGVSDRPYAEQIGQAFKFSVLYGTAYKVLFGITQTLQGALNEGVEFQQAMTELAIASGQSQDQMEAVRKSLGEAATEAGAAPSQGVLVGARSLGLFGAAAGSGASAAEQDRIAEISAKVVSRAAFGSGQQPADLQSNLAAIAQAFQQGAEGQVRAYDLDAFLSRKFGIAPGSTYASVADSATVGRAAGFSQEEVTAIAADIQSRMGTTPTAVAGYMAQIFSRAGEGALVGVDQKYGVDSSADLATQLKALADIYRKNPAARDDISAVGGRGKVQNAFIALLQDYGAVQSAAKEAETGALGAGDKSFNLRLANVGGQLAQLGGDFKALESELGRSGLLTVLGAGVKVLDETVKGLTGLLTVWDQLDGVTKSLIATLLVEEAVRRSGVLSRGATTAADDLLAGTMYARPGAAEAGAAKGAGAGAALRSAAGPVAILAAAVGVGLAANASRRLQDSRGSTINELTTASVGPGSTADDYRSEAAALQLQADDAKKAASGFFAKVVEFGEGANRDAALAATAHTEAQRLQALGQYKDQLAAQAPPSSQLITSFDTEGLDSSLQAITTNGGNARDRLNAVAASLDAGANAAKRAADSFDPHLFAGEGARPIYEALGKSGSQYGLKQNLDYYGLTALGSGRAFTQALTPAEVAARLQSSLQKRDISSQRDITGAAASKIATDVVGNTPEAYLKSLGITDPKKITELQKSWVAQVRKLLLGQAASVKDILSGKVILSQAELTATIAQYTSDTQALLGGLQQTDTGSRVQALRSLIQRIRAAIADTPGGDSNSQAQDALNQARRQLAEQQIADLEDLRRAAQQNAHGKRQIASVGRSFLVREINVAVRGGDSDALINIVQTAGKGGIEIARNAIQQAIKVAQAALSIQAQVQQFAAAEVAGIRGFIQSQGGNVSNPKAQRRLDELNQMLGALNHSMHGNKGTDVYTSGSDANLPDAGSAGTKGPTAAQIAAARQSAIAGGSESQIAQARAAIATARADMAAAKKGTTDYYSALGAYLQARNQLTDAIGAYRTNLYLLNHDATDPLVQARSATRAAAAALKADAGKPPDVRAADRVALQQAQASQEATRFQQRLEAAQTAEQLGRTSFRAYINYLDNERDRLERIKHRTFQQQQELNQIDQALQEASSSMQGVFNFGDINVPKPYQVRRYIEENYGGGSGASGVINDGPKRPKEGDTTVLINGADTRMVMKVIRDVLGSNVRLETTKPRKR